MARRVPVRANVSLRLAGRVRGGLAKDISEGGLFLHTTAPVNLGSRIELSIGLPGNHQVSARAQVVRRDDTRDGFGLVFVELSSADREAIRSYVASVAVS